ncbi:MAG: pantetheine-phosphate adenylyltransferase [Planctomycetes bacterium]|nr:pantetheine-phosphate adenylyltransferase [Planctomycetota bacterium]NOG55858.1 pantetheine-phosphate adenylyltransferase [Planctomycetota bacterium]
MTTTTTRPNHRAIYTGSFDPITLGHLDVIKRGRVIFDDLIIAIGRNIGKREVFGLAERKCMVTELVDEMVAGQPDGGSVSVETYDGLTVDFARAKNARVILRGIRNITDLAYECQLAMTNRTVADLETVFIMTSQEYAYTSSNLIKQIAALGGSVDHLHTIVPRNVIEALRKLQADKGLAHLIEDHVD